MGTLILHILWKGHNFPNWTRYCFRGQNAKIHPKSKSARALDSGSSVAITSLIFRSIFACDTCFENAKSCLLLGRYSNGFHRWIGNWTRKKTNVKYFFRFKGQIFGGPPNTKSLLKTTCSETKENAAINFRFRLQVSYSCTHETIPDIFCAQSLIRVEKWKSYNDFPTSAIRELSLIVITVNNTSRLNQGRSIMVYRFVWNLILWVIISLRIVSDNSFISISSTILDCRPV
jgi:hypothetical protein